MLIAKEDGDIETPMYLYEVDSLMALSRRSPVLNAGLSSTS